MVMVGSAGQHNLTLLRDEAAAGKVADEGIDQDSGNVFVEVGPRHFRPTGVNLLIGDPRKAHNKLGWRHRVMFDELVHEMVSADLRAIRSEAKPR